MLNRKQISVAVDLHQRSYELLRWMADAVTRGFIVFDTAHDYATLPEAAEKWISRHYNDIPLRARPDRSQLADFSALFSTYLQNSFDLMRDPGKQLYSPDAHCFCPMCSWLVDAPNLKTKKPTPVDKRRARKMKATVVRTILSDQNLSLSYNGVDAITNDIDLREDLSLVTYAQDLIGRTKGITVGPASLVLWRSFAWTREGSPKKGFALSVEMILESEQVLYQTVLGAAVSSDVAKGGTTTGCS